ncbi:MAG: hypothetical protein FD189_1071 [Elusimicrobia bacterium]|nr:MAG: hypothetical protein FD189_1071 [Elusimicrobiota bacterium]
MARMKRCPFCGGTPNVRAQVLNRKWSQASVGCVKCEVRRSVWAHTKREAIAAATSAWNMRKGGHA